MSEFTTAVKVLDSFACSCCAGLGSCDDLEPGDISGNSWSCKECNGTGFKLGYNVVEMRDELIKQQAQTIERQQSRIKDYQAACEQKQEIINGLQELVTSSQAQTERLRNAVIFALSHLTSGMNAERRDGNYVTELQEALKHE